MKKLLTQPNQMEGNNMTLLDEINQSKLPAVKYLLKRGYRIKTSIEPIQNSGLGLLCRRINSSKVIRYTIFDHKGRVVDCIYSEYYATPTYTETFFNNLTMKLQ